eukprot:gene42745-53033_t
MVAVTVGMLAIMFATRLIVNSEQNKAVSLGGSDQMQNGMLALFSISEDAAQAGWGMNDDLIAGCNTVFSDTAGYALPAADRGGVAITPLAAVVIRNNASGSDELSLNSGSSPSGVGSVRVSEAYAAPTRSWPPAQRVLRPPATAPAALPQVALPTPSAAQAPHSAAPVRPWPAQAAAPAHPHRRASAPNRPHFPALARPPPERTNPARGQLLALVSAAHQGQSASSLPAASKPSSQPLETVQVRAAAQQQECLPHQRLLRGRLSLALASVQAALASAQCADRSPPAAVPSRAGSGRETQTSAHQ